MTAYRRMDEDQHIASAWEQSPFYHLETSGEDLLRRRIEPGEEPDFPILRDLAELGDRDYIALVSRFGASGQIGEMDCIYSSWASNHEDGFSDEQVAELPRLVLHLALALRGVSLMRIAESIAETYLGRDTGRRVLSGSITRGVPEKISAVIWFSDLRGFTKISDTANPGDIIPFLNDYAEAVIESVHDAGGEVLKLLGDGTLAIFRSPALADACHAAIEAERSLRERIAEVNERRRERGVAVTDVYLGLHVGEVFYGNIGSEDRLDFTVVGSAVNEASRIAAFCRSVERDVLLSPDFHEAAPGQDREICVSVGRYALRGIGQPRELYTVVRG
jgi:adenylate cyclase